MPRRIDAGPLLAGVGALLLLISLSLDWYEPGLSPWTVFETLDLVLAAAAIATIAVVAARLRWELPVRDRALPILGALAFVVVASQLINHPPAVAFDEHDPETGAWLALAGSALMLAGGVLSVAHISLSVSYTPRKGEPPQGGSEARPEPAGAPAASREPRPYEEAAAAEPEVKDELYPDQERRGPIGVDDPEPWTAGPSDETVDLEDGTSVRDPDERERPG
jgi:hypothetical protein